MSEQTQQQNSPLESERGSTIISESVVSTLVSRAAGKVEGVYLGGDPSGDTGLVGRVRGSSRGISVEVGRTEVALDLTLGIDYGKDIAGAIERLRRGITDEVENTTGLRVRELNATITHIIFPGSQDQGRERTVGPSEGEETAELNDAGEQRVS